MPSEIADAKDIAARSDVLPPVDCGLMAALVGLKLLLHIPWLNRYGYFRDEMYFLDCARHLAWGYVDHAPLIGVYARIALLMGGSLPALRILPVLAGAGLVALAMRMTRELGGARFAQGLAGLCVLLAPVNLVMDDMLSMNAFEPLYWMGCAYVVMRIVRTGNSKLWVWFGVLSGLGLENKHSTLFFGFAVFLAVLLTDLRREFAKPWIWLGGAAAALIFLPNLLWQIQYRFPTLEDLENVRRTGKNVALGPVRFVAQQIFMEHPILFPAWFAGLGSFLWGRGKQMRVLGWTFVIFFVTMLVMHAKDYYLAPIYPMLYAGGAVATEDWLRRRSWAGEHLWPKFIIIAVPALLGGMLVPLLTPMLSPEQHLAYAHALHLRPTKTEVAESGPLPQFFGDQFGWPELVADVAKVYWSLPTDVRAKTGILTGNYGEAGAIDLFGPKYGLPRAISAHQTYFYWGPPSTPLENLITLQYSRGFLQRGCDSVQLGSEHYHPWGMDEENGPIYVCRGLKKPLAEVWPELKHWN